MIPDTASPTASTIIPDGETLTVDSLLRIASDPKSQIELTPEIRKRVIASRKLLDEFVESGRIIYGVTTSVGGFVNWLIPPSHAEETQINIMRTAQSNVGPCLDDHYVRASMLARINSLGRGYSAISIENLDKYVAMYNHGVLPCIPEKGSLGASGDLGPLACIGLVGAGEWRAKFDDEVMPGAAALKKAGIEPMKLSYKEGLALINGTSVMTAIAACLVAESKSLIKTYTLTTCMSLEVHKAKIMPFHSAAHRQKPHAGQGLIAECIYNTLANSKMIVQDEETEKWLRTLATDVPRGLDEQIEDVYSIRATPQVLGPVVDTTLFVEGTVETEINSSNDNPLVVVEDGEAVHNANFHGQYISNAMDQLAIVLVNMCNLSDRRNNRLLHPSLNGSLPPFLVKENPGVRMGLMGGQFLATSLTAENRQMCMPMSIQTLPSTGDFQDHVSMGMNAARRTRDILDNSRHVLAFELICACQAADLRGVDQLSSATRKLYDMVRKQVPYLDHDDPMTDHIESIAAMYASGEFLEAVPQEVEAYNW